MGIPHGGGGWTTAAKPCDSCKLGAAGLFCRADFAFLCLTCDAKIHAPNKLSTRHERVWLCEVCEQAPAVVTCKAGAAALCVTCDADIHAANPLARRHERVPVEPFFDSAESVVKSSGFNFLVVPNENGNSDDGDGGDAEEESPWLLPNLNIGNSKVVENLEMKSGNMFFSEMDQFIDFDYSNSIEPKYQPENDSVVPVQSKLVTPSENCFDIDFCRSKLSPFGYTNPPLNPNVSSCSHDVGVVPEANLMSDVSPQIFPNTNQATQLSGMDREARVLRYREKRKNRKFEKTIRYASRKAYAETRPRIKGRFAKRNKEIDEEHVGELYSSGLVGFMDDNQYCIVPSF